MTLRRLLLVAICMSGVACTKSTEQDRQVAVLFTSDEHSHLFAHSPELDDYPAQMAPGSGALLGGVARRAAILARERSAAAAAGQASITVSAGDNQMGGLTHVAFTSASLDYGLLAALGYDVTTFGNHEFDFGPKALAQSIATARAGAGLPPIVASNVHFSGGAGDADLAKLYSLVAGDGAAVHPYRVLTAANGLRIGVLGYVGVNAEHVAPNKTPTTFSAQGDKSEGKPDAILPKLYADLQPVVDQLRNSEHADLVVALAHAGLVDPKTGADIAQSEDYQVAQNVRGIDLIISGHQHLTDPTPVVVQGPDRAVLVLNASRFGEHVGRVVFTVHGDGSAPSWDPTSQALLTVDDTTPPDAAMAARLPALLTTIEKASFAASQPFLPALVARIEGSAEPIGAGKPGDLYFRAVANTDFDVIDTDTIELLSADAMRAAANAGGKTTEIGLESAGVIRSVLKRGKTGVIALCDAFDVVPLGSSPVDGTLGYPLVRANISLFELRAVFELVLSLGPANSDFRIDASGARVEYDATRPPAKTVADLVNPNKGQVMRILLNSDPAQIDQFDKVVYDRAKMIGDPAALFSVVTSSYIAQFATDVGATLKDDQGNKLTLAQAILHRADGSEIKQFESLLQYLKASASLQAMYGPGAMELEKRMACLAGCK